MSPHNGSSHPGPSARPTVAVIGGGYGGTAVAKALDEIADVVLVEAKDSFVHNVAALRGLVDPDWADRLFLPYDRLLPRGTVRRGRAVHVDATAVTLADGERITADYTVLATGSGYPFPAKFDTDDSAAAKARLHTVREALAASAHVLLLGAGPVGLELAGEIRAAWPGKRVTVTDPAAELLPGFPDAFRARVRDELAGLGIEVLLGTALSGPPPTEPGTFQPFTVRTEGGHSLGADLWLRCHGVVPATGYLDEALAATARRADGHLLVTPELRLAGQERLFALGDITAVPEAKTAKAANEHAGVVAANLRALITGEGELATHTPGAPAMALPLGPERGATYSPEMGVLDAAATAEMKGADLMLSVFAEIFGIPERALTVDS
ncbi:FAD-dependent oxidoreductase [Streptomyces sp. NBC_01186]|uniref:NAD(P)/FAD-dependent oxidoreductase n=1 Tax=Streptomyces sp. NBC_01186 TaxID=2903765 RepID=UPI002E0E260B|nr:FAD-dependent oxidoreductase [Streptomyces sp. NBC_01186]